MMTGIARRALDRNSDGLMVKQVLLGLTAAFIGLVVAGVAVGTIETANVFLYPELSRKAAEDPTSIRLADVPTGAVVTILVAWCVGATLGAFVAAWFTARIIRRRSLLPAYGFGLLFLLACATQLNAIPHPTWFAAAGIAGPAILTMVAAKFALRRFYRRSATKEKPPVEKHVVFGGAPAGHPARPVADEERPSP